MDYGNLSSKAWQIIGFTMEAKPAWLGKSELEALHASADESWAIPIVERLSLEIDWLDPIVEATKFFGTICYVYEFASQDLLKPYLARFSEEVLLNLYEKYNDHEYGFDVTNHILTVLTQRCLVERQAREALPILASIVRAPLSSECEICDVATTLVHVYQNVIKDAETAGKDTALALRFMLIVTEKLPQDVQEDILCMMGVGLE